MPGETGNKTPLNQVFVNEVESNGWHKEGWDAAMTIYDTLHHEFNSLDGHHIWATLVMTLILIILFLML